VVPHILGFFIGSMITSESVFLKPNRSTPSQKQTGQRQGVEPDVKVKAADALETAVKLAESNNIGIPWMTSKGDGLQFPGRVNHCIA